VNPEGIQSSSPGLAFFSQPWDRKTKRSNPDGVASATLQARSETDTTLSGLRIDFFISPGLAENANPGLEDEIPSGFILRLNSARCPGEL